MERVDELWREEWMGVSLKCARGSHSPETRLHTRAHSNMDQGGLGVGGLGLRWSPSDDILHLLLPVAAAEGPRRCGCLLLLARHRRALTLAQPARDTATPHWRHWENVLS